MCEAAGVVAPVVGGVISLALVGVTLYLLVTERAFASLVVLAIGAVVLIGGFVVKIVAESTVDGHCPRVVSTSSACGSWRTGVNRADPG